MSDDRRLFLERKREITGWLSEEFAGIQSGAMLPSLLNGVTISAYGAKTALHYAASVTSEEPRVLLVVPYDQTLTQEMETALREQVPSATVSVNDTGIRITAHELTAERRDMLARVVKERAEEAKKSIRGVREKLIGDIRKRKTGDSISEDEEFMLKKQIQEEVDGANAEIDDMCKSKMAGIQA